jgi:hypothetical protein
MRRILRARRAWGWKVAAVVGHVLGCGTLAAAIWGLSATVGAIAWAVVVHGLLGSIGAACIPDVRDDAPAVSGLQVWLAPVLAGLSCALWLPVSAAAALCGVVSLGTAVWERAEWREWINDQHTRARRAVVEVWEQQRRRRDAALVRHDGAYAPDDDIWEDVPFAWKGKWMGVLRHAFVPARCETVASIAARVHGPTTASSADR